MRPRRPCLAETASCISTHVCPPLSNAQLLVFPPTFAPPFKCAAACISTHVAPLSNFKCAAATAQACSRYALVGPPGAQFRRSTIFETISGNFKLKVTNLQYTQSEIQANGNAIPVLLHLRDNCELSDVFPSLAITYAVFNSRHDCCPIGIVVPPPFPSPSPPPSPPQPPSPPLPPSPP
eukprot:366506-Chlamydomonas_euryale.AAC.1